MNLGGGKHKPRRRKRKKRRRKTKKVTTKGLSESLGEKIVHTVSRLSQVLKIARFKSGS